MIIDLIKAFITVKRERKERQALDSLTLDYESLKKIARENDRRVEILLKDGTLIKFYDKVQNNTEDRPEFW